MEDQWKITVKETEKLRENMSFCHSVHHSTHRDLLWIELVIRDDS